MTGIKYNEGKLKLNLIPPEAILALGRALTYGDLKYNPNGDNIRNWEKGMSWGNVYAALQRHLLAWSSGEEKDPESGLSHLDHALTNLAFLITYQERNTGIDDRFLTQEFKIQDLATEWVLPTAPGEVTSREAQR
jgi:hypothetical protein